MSPVNLRLWLNFHLCDEWSNGHGVARTGANGGSGGGGGADDGGPTKFSLRAFLWKGIRIEFYDAFGLLWYSVAVYRSLDYVVSHHQREDTMKQEKQSWEHSLGHVDETQTDITIMFEQSAVAGDEDDEMVGVNGGGKERMTTAMVSIKGHVSFLSAFMSSCFLLLASFFFDSIPHLLEHARLHLQGNSSPVGDPNGDY